MPALHVVFCMGSLPQFLDEHCLICSVYIVQSGIGQNCVLQSIQLSEALCVDNN